jgi:hypothetical protein
MTVFFFVDVFLTTLEKSESETIEENNKQKIERSQLMMCRAKV